MSTPARPVHALADDFVAEYARLFPVQATMAGIRGVHDGWEDYSPEGAGRALAALRTFRERFASLPEGGDRWDRLGRRVALEFLDDRIGFYEAEEHLADLNNIESSFQHVKMVFELMDATTADGARAIATRLESIQKPLAGWRASLEEGLRRGRGAAKRQVRAVIDQARVHGGPGSSLLTIPRAASELGDPALVARIEAAIAHAQGLYRDLATWLETEYLPRAPERDPVGEARYARSARRFLGDDLDLRETYAWGWREIADIEAKMRAVCARIAPGKSVRDVIETLRRDPSTSAGTLDQFLVRMRELQARALADLDGTHFHVPEPIRRIEVKLAPPGTALGAYYIPPSDGFTRPGTVYYVPGEDTSYPLFEEITTAYHEGFPGHHLQCSLQVHFADRLTTLHRLLVCMSGYAEGWALYAEQLMHELGYLDRPEYELGMYLAKLFRACRVVIDIGLHLELPVPEGLDAAIVEPARPGEVWSYDLAKRFMEHHAMVRPDFAASEITRYLGWPGQAISYKVGERIILDLREEARRDLGDRFDLRAFHDAVLSTGSVGLSLLRDVVREQLGMTATA